MRFSIVSTLIQIIASFLLSRFDNEQEELMEVEGTNLMELYIPRHMIYF